MMQGFMMGSAAEPKSSGLAAFFASWSSRADSDGGFAGVLADAMQGPLAYLRANGVTVSGERRPLLPALAQAAENLAGQLGLPLAVEAETPIFDPASWIRAVLQRTSPKSLSVQENAETEAGQASSDAWLPQSDLPEGTLVVQPVEAAPADESPIVLVLEPETDTTPFTLPPVDGESVDWALWVIPEAVSEESDKATPGWEQVLTTLIHQFAPSVEPESMAVNEEAESGISEPVEWKAATLAYEGGQAMLVFMPAAPGQASEAESAEGLTQEVASIQTVGDSSQPARPAAPPVAVVFRFPPAVDAAANSFAGAVQEISLEQPSPGPILEPVSQSVQMPVASVSVRQLESLAHSAEQPIPVLVRVDAQSGEVLIRPRVDASRQGNTEMAPASGSAETTLSEVRPVSERPASVLSISPQSVPSVSGGEEVSPGEAISGGKAAAEPNRVSESVSRVQVKAVMAERPETTYRVSAVPKTFQMAVESPVLGERQVPDTGQLRQVVRLLESLSGSVEQVRVTTVSRPDSQAVVSASVESVAEQTTPEVAKTTTGVAQAVSRPEIGSAVKADPIPFSTVSTSEKGVGTGTSPSLEVQAKPVAASGYSVLRKDVAGFQPAVNPSPPQPVFAFNRTQPTPEPVAPQAQPSVSTAGVQDPQPVELYRAVAETSQSSQLQPETVEIPRVRQASASASSGMDRVPIARTVAAQPVSYVQATVNVQPGLNAEPSIQPRDASIPSETSVEAKGNRALRTEAVELVAKGSEPVVKSGFSAEQARPQSVPFENGAAPAPVAIEPEEVSMQPVRKASSAPSLEVSRAAGTDLPRVAEVRGAMNVEGIARPPEPVPPMRQPVALGRSPMLSNASQSKGVQADVAQANAAPSESEASPMALKPTAQPLTMRKPVSASGESVKEFQPTIPGAERPVASGEQSKANAKDLSASSELRLPRTEKPEEKSERSLPGKELQPTANQPGKESASPKPVKLDPEQVAEGLEAARQESVRTAVRSGSSEKSALANSPAPQRLSRRSVELVAPAEREAEPVAETSEKGADRTFEVERSREQWRPQTEPRREKAIDSALRAKSEGTLTPRVESIPSRPDAAGAPAPMPGASSAVSAARELAQMERIATALDEQRTIQQVAVQAKDQAGQNQGEIRVQLEPDQLGKLRMQIGVEDGVVRARIVTETAEARAMLERHLPDLKVALGEQGLRVQEVRLISASGGEQPLSGFEGQSHSYRHGGTGTPQEQRQAWTNDSSSWTPDRQPKQEHSRPHPDRWRNLANSGRVDYRA